MPQPRIESITETDVGGATTTPTFNMPAVRPDGAVYILWAIKDDDADWGSVPSKFNTIITEQVGSLMRGHAWWWVGDAARDGGSRQS